MAASIIVIEIPRQLPLAFILTRGSQGARAVWASRQGGNLRISPPKPAPTLAEIDPRLSHPSETPERVEQVVRLHLHRRPSGRSVKAKIRALTHKTSQWELAYLLTRLGQILRGWANYFKHAVAKSTFSKLDTFTWWRLAHMLRARHGWNFGQLSRHLTTPGGGGCSQRTGSSTSDRGRSRFSRQLPPPPDHPRTPPDGSNRGEPVAERLARRVRRAAQGNRPAATPTLPRADSTVGWLAALAALPGS